MLLFRRKKILTKHKDPHILPNCAFISYYSEEKNIYKTQRPTYFTKLCLHILLFRRRKKINKTQRPTYFTKLCLHILLFRRKKYIQNTKTHIFYQNVPSYLIIQMIFSNIAFVQNSINRRNYHTPISTISSQGKLLILLTFELLNIFTVKIYREIIAQLGRLLL